MKSRIQNAPRQEGLVPKYNWTYPALAVVYREEGFRALYKGFAPKVLRLGPGGGILLVAQYLMALNFRLCSIKLYSCSGVFKRLEQSIRRCMHIIRELPRLSG